MGQLNDQKYEEIKFLLSIYTVLYIKLIQGWSSSSNTLEMNKRTEEIVWNKDAKKSTKFQVNVRVSDGKSSLEGFFFFLLLFP